MIDLQPLDYFVTRNPWPIVRTPINMIQAWNSPNRTAQYNHAGLIIDSDGTTLEAGIRIDGKRFHRIGRRNLWTDYAGVKTMIVRCNATINHVSRVAICEDLVMRFDGALYPYWRLPLFAYPPLARRIGVKRFGVCSELVSMAFVRARAMEAWMGVSPDDLADMARMCTGCPCDYDWQRWQILHEGVI